MTKNTFSLDSFSLLHCVALLLIVFARTSEGHAYFSSLTIDGVVLKEGECTRPHPSSRYDYPISALDRPNGLSSGDMTCGWLPAASKAANKKCAVNPGSTIGMQWHYEMGMGSSDTFIIDPSHKGPCIVYMAKSETGAGAVWFKIFEDGYDQTTKKWCVDKLRANKGLFTAKIPTDITPGNYLLRVELIALHEGHEMNGAQPYVGCAELTVAGSGTVNPGNLVSFPGAYTPSDAGIYFNIYSGKNPAYPIPGPKLYVSGSTPTPSPPPAITTGKKASTTTTTTTTTTTAARASTTTTTTAARASTTTTTTTTGKGTTGKGSTTTTTTTTTGAQTTTTTGQSSGAQCYLPGTPNLNGRISGTCGKKAPRNRCPDGQCCSQWGYCGPVAEDDGRYYEQVDGRMKYVSSAFAFQLYCNKTSGDYRKVNCNSIQTGILATNELKETGASNTIVDRQYLRMLLFIVIGLTSITFFF